MSLEAVTTELLLHNDKRLLAAIPAVIDYAGERASLSQAARDDLQTATSAACSEAFALAGKNGNSDTVVKMFITGFPDRVEIAIEHRGDSTIGNDLKNVDRVESSTHSGISRTTLIKYGAASKFEHRS